MDDSKIYKINNNIKIINDDCLNAIPNLDDNSIDLVVTSPPYNVDLGNNKFNNTPYDLYNDNKDHKEYISWLEEIFRKFYPKVKSGGRLAINVGDGKNGKIPTHADIIHFMTNKIGYIPMANIIWQKSQIGNRFSWGSFASPSSPSFPKPFEYIMIFAKEDVKLKEEGETDLTKDEFKRWAFSFWEFAPETRMEEMNHPAMFPEELPYRLIKMLSWRDSLIVDPFNGMGTTGLVCKGLGRKYIGIDISKDYCERSFIRIKNGMPVNYEPSRNRTKTKNKTEDIDLWEKDD